MDCTVSDIKEERLIGGRSFARLHHGDCFVGDVVGEVIAIGVGIGFDRCVVANQAMRLMKVCESVKESVEAIKASLARPRVTRPGIGLVRVFGQMPFADHVSGVTVRSKSLGEGDNVIGQFHRVTRKPWISVCDRSDTGSVRIHAGEEGGTRWRAHRS